MDIEAGCPVTPVFSWYDPEASESEWKRRPPMRRFFSGSADIRNMITVPHLFLSPPLM